MVLRWLIATCILVGTLLATVSIADPGDPSPGDPLCTVDG